VITSGLKPATANAIDSQVEKLLRGLGMPEPPLDLAAVRELLSLDKRFYSTSADGLLREKVSRMTVGLKRVFSQPMLLITAIKKLELRALYIPEQKVILLDDALPAPKLRWNEAHEVGHSILEWHQEMLLGDTKITLSPECHERIENEANFAAGRLLFLRDRFTAECLDSEASIKNIQRLSKTFGNTITSTLWRTIETLPYPAVGILSPHPKYRPEDGQEAWRYFIRSPQFERQFAKSSPESVFNQVRGYCGYTKRGPLGAGDVEITDDNGTSHIFAFETFHNSHESLTLGRYKAPKLVTVGFAL
jgi:hypothetical protein